MAYIETGSSVADSTIVLRELKGSPLNIAEFDHNSQVVVDALNDLDSRVTNIIAGEVSYIYAEYEVTIASGVAVCNYESAYYILDTEGAAATDSLTQVTGLAAGVTFILSPADNDRVVTVEHGTYLKLLGGNNFTMANVRSKMFLRHLGSNVCEEISRSQNL